MPTSTPRHASRNYRILIRNKETVLKLNRLKLTFIIAPETMSRLIHQSEGVSAIASLSMVLTPSPLSSTLPVAPASSAVLESHEPSVPQHTRSGRSLTLEEECCGHSLRACFTHQSRASDCLCDCNRRFGTNSPGSIIAVASRILPPMQITC